LIINFVVQQPNLGLRCLIVEVYRSHIIRHTHTHTNTRSRTPLNKWAAHHKGCCLHNTQQTYVIWNHNPSNQAAADLRLRPQLLESADRLWMYLQIMHKVLFLSQQLENMSIIWIF